MSEATSSYARVYRDVLSTKPLSYYDYENIRVDWGDQDPYKIVRKIGRGKYSDVFEGVVSSQNVPCSIKVLKPVKSKKYYREILILQNLLDGPNIIQLYDVVMEPSTHTPSLIMEYVDNVDFKVLYPQLSYTEIAYYLKELLVALDFTHSMGIIHRDVKPHNVMIDPKRKQLKLIDWGLAEFYKPGTPFNVRVASRYYKGPELLVDMQQYDYSLDMWSFGLKNFFEYTKTYKLTIDEKQKKLLTDHKRIKWNQFINKKNSHLVTPDVLDFISKLLLFDHYKRLTAKEAMDHSLFSCLSK
ncbi:non-specific serine/threonine protein kinase [Entamoeba marina]